MIYRFLSTQRKQQRIPEQQQQLENNLFILSFKSPNCQSINSKRNYITTKKLKEISSLAIKIVDFVVT